MGFMIVSTYPDKKSIIKVANIVVKKKLAACVNYVQINSIYNWKGKIENNDEFLALFKTTHRAKKNLKEEITRSHPYQVPEIVEFRMDNINLPYLRWLENSTLDGIPKKRNNSSKR